MTKSKEHFATWRGGVDDFVDEVLEAGGEIAKRNVEQSIMQHGHYRTGTLLRSIRIIKDKDREGRKYVDVTAAGKRENGTRNGEVAFVLNYGRSNLYGTRYWQAAEEKKGAKEKRCWIVKRA